MSFGEMAFRYMAVHEDFSHVRVLLAPKELNKPFRTSHPQIGTGRHLKQEGPTNLGGPERLALILFLNAGNVIVDRHNYQVFVFVFSKLILATTFKMLSPIF